MSNLKARVKKLEEGSSTKEVPGIIIYFENRVMEKDVVVSADYYLNEDRTEPVALEEINELNKQMIVFLPFEDREEDIEYHIIETETV